MRTKVEVDKVEIALATDRSLGSLSFEGRTRDCRRLEVEYRFPDNCDLFSPDGGYSLRVAVDGVEVELSDELDEEFRDSLPRRVYETSYKRACSAAKVLVRSL